MQKASLLNAKLLLAQILWPTEWSDEALDKELYGEIIKSPVLEKEMIVVDDKTGERILLFKEFDNPKNSESLLETMILIEETLQDMSSQMAIATELDQKSIFSLITKFSSVKARLGWEQAIATQKYERYKNVLNLMYNMKVNYQMETLEKEHSEITKNLPENISKIEKEKEERKNALREDFSVEQKKLLEKLNNDDEITSVERKKQLKELIDEFKDRAKQIDVLYKEKQKAKEAEVTMNRDLKYKAFSKSYADTLASNSLGYQELARKTQILKLMKDYFENRSNDLNGFIITLNMMYKNTVNLI